MNGLAKNSTGANLRLIPAMHIAQSFCFTFLLLSKATPIAIGAKDFQVFKKHTNLTIKP